MNDLNQNDASDTVVLWHLSNIGEVVRDIAEHPYEVLSQQDSDFLNRKIKRLGVLISAAESQIQSQSKESSNDS